MGQLMMSSLFTGEIGKTVNVFTKYSDRLREAMSHIARERISRGEFEPEFELPSITEEVREYFAVGDLRFADMTRFRQSRLVLLDLMRNPGTRTVKTLASLVIVARAVRHIHQTGERIMIITPSSANKATALRDAVLRAYSTGLVDPEQLRIVSVVPDGARPKLWSSALSADHGLALRNPLCVYQGGPPGALKSVVRETATDCAGELWSRHGFRLWHTLDLDNYRCADALRALAEHELLPLRPGLSRTHAHAVSSAFGLLGHHFGASRLAGAEVFPKYFLVQHLATPDMVLSLFDATVPDYRFDPVAGVYRQEADPRFPASTFDLEEDLEPTFYTKNPPTSHAMNEIISDHGGGGIVVSLHECLARYGEIRAALANAQVEIPADPRRLREWSLVMAMTGVLNAIDRKLLETDEVIVHGSGSYSQDDFTSVPQHRLRVLAGPADLRQVITDAVAGTS